MTMVLTMAYVKLLSRMKGFVHQIGNTLALWGLKVATLLSKVRYSPT